MTPTGFRVVRTRWFDTAAGKRSALVADPVAAFAERGAADEHAEELERVAWLDPAFNPFDLAGSLCFLTGLPDWALRDWVQDHGLAPPQKNRPWHRWYESKRPDPLLIREALGKLRLFAVEPLGARAWAAGEVPYAATFGNHFEPTDEGHTRVRLYADRADAQSGADELTRSIRATAVGTYSHGLRYGDGDYLFYSPRVTTFAEVFPVDCPAGLPRAGAAHLVVRTMCGPGPFSGYMYGNMRPDAVVPLAAFPTAEAAAARLAERDAAARAAVNPFAFYPVHRLADDAVDRVRAAWPGAPAELPVVGRDFWGWAGAWDLAQPDVTDDIRAAVWAEVARPPLFSAQAVDWHG